MRLAPRSLAFTLLLGALSALPPLSIDLGLPALPALGSALRASPSLTGMTLSLFLAGFALAQLALGLLSDRVGRRPVLVAALAVFSAAGLACSAATDIAMLLAARLAQGIGAGAGTVLSFAIVRDLFEGDEARAKLAYVSVVMSIAPIVAPSLGSSLLALGGWRAIYGVLAVTGAGLTTLVALGLAETRTTRARTDPGSRYATLLRSRAVLVAAGVNACSFACMFAYVTASPLVFLQYYRVSSAAFGAIFACTAGGLLAGAALSGGLARRGVAVDIVLTSGVLLQAISALVVLGLMTMLPFASALILVPVLAVNTFSLGLIGPNASHLALASQPRAVGGAVSAIMGAAQMTAGSIASALVGALHPIAGAAGMAWVMTPLAVISAVLWLLAKSGRSDPTCTHAEPGEEALHQV